MRPSKNWDFDIPLSRKDDPVEDFINYSLERPSMPIVICSFGRTKGVTHQEQRPRFMRRIRNSWAQLGAALEALRNLTVREILRARSERWGGGGNDGDGNDVDNEDGNENEVGDADMAEGDDGGEGGDSEEDERISKKVRMHSG